MKKFSKEQLISTLWICVLIFVISFAVQFVKITDGESVSTTQSFAVDINLIDIPNLTNGAEAIGFSAIKTTAAVAFSLLDVENTITYRIRIVNSGTMDARLEKISITGLSEYIDYDVNGAVIGSKLYPASNNTFHIVFKYDTDAGRKLVEDAVIEFRYKQMK